MKITQRFTDPDGDYAGSITIEARTWGATAGYGLGIGTPSSSAFVVTNLDDLVALRSSLDELIEASR